MTTAYTSLLGLALPVTGELSGTWGDTVNNSITSLLDSAIAGTQTLTADTTLTTTTGAANQSRQAILLCSPASANITITAPAQSKIYTVINTSATYTVKICGVGPTTGVTLAVSESAVVAWNGTDFIRISSSNSTTGNFTVNGNLVVTGNTTLGDADTDTITQTASYVTGTQLKSAKTATNTLNLAAYDTDGAAYTNLITLTASTTPTLALTSTGVGTINNMSVGATTASTGAFTTLSATGVATFSAGSAAAPAITTTGDTNTGIWFPAADTIAFTEGGVESMRIDSSGNVGIGTTSPSGLLHLSGNTAATTAPTIVLQDSGTTATRLGTLTNDGGDLVLAMTASLTDLRSAITLFDDRKITFTTNAAERMRIDSSGNLLLGTSTNITGLVSAPKQIIYGSTATDGAGVYPATLSIIDDRAYNSTSPQPGGGITFGYKYNVAGSIALGPSIQGFKENTTDADFASGIKFLTRANGSPPAERMRIDASGNVGIGTTSPAQGLEVLSAGVAFRSSKTASTSSNTRMYGGAYTGNLATIAVLNGTSGANDLIIGGGTSGGEPVSTILIYTGTAGTTGAGTEKIRIDSSGNVGIGVTPSAWTSIFKAVQVKQGSISTDSSNNTTFANNCYFDGANWKYINTAASQQYLQYAGTHIWNTAASGTAGNTITFTQAMTLDASSLLSLVGSGSGLKITRRDTSAQAYVIYSSAGNLQFFNGTSDAMTLDASGNLAIGATSAAGRLLVVASDGTAPNNTTANGALKVRSTATAAVGAGPSITFEGQTGNTTANFAFAGIQGFKGSATAADYSGVLAFYTQNSGGSTALTERMRIDSSGNVAIGGTNPQGARVSITGGTLPTAQSGLVMSSGLTAGRLVTGDTNSATAVINQYLDLSTTELSAGTSGSLTSGLAVAGGTAAVNPNTVRLFTAGAERMRIDSSGNLGIGTSSPAYRLDVLGSARLKTGASGTPVIISTGSDSQGTLRFGSTGNEYSINGGSDYVGMIFNTAGSERMRIDTTGNAQFSTGAVMPYAPAPAGIAAATTLTNANIQTQIISATGTTYTITMPLGTTLETLATWATTGIGYDFYVINTASGTVTMAVNTGVTSLGTLTIATGVSAQFRIRRTAANTFVLYRLG